MAEELPPLTVVTPVYNGEAFIRETVASILAQDHPQAEHLVIDDGSTDGTLAHLDDFKGRVRIVSQENRGEAAAVNEGVRLASHDIVGVVNADDPVLPGLLSRVARAFAEDATLSAVYPDWQWIDAAGTTVRTVRTQEFQLRSMLEQHLCIPGPGAFFRRSHLRDARVRDPARRTSADFDFWLRLGLTGKVRRIPEVLATWRCHPAGTSSARRDAAMAHDRVAVVEAFFARDDLPQEVARLRSQALSAAYFSAGLLAVRSPGVPAVRYFVRSFLHKPVWPPGIAPSQRRSPAHMLYAACQPLSGALHEALSPLLPPRYRRLALLEQKFGVSDVG